MTPARAAVLAAPFASGLLLWAASPPVGFGWAAWVALLPAAAVALAAPATRWGRAAVPLAVVVFLELLLVPALPFGLADDQWGQPVVPILVGGSPVLDADGGARRKLIGGDLANREPPARPRGEPLVARPSDRPAGKDGVRSQHDERRPGSGR